MEASNLESLKLEKFLSTKAPGYKYTEMYKRKLWDGNVSVFKNNRFPSGLLPKVAKKFDCEIIDKRTFPEFQFGQKITLPLRDYQLDAVKRCLRNQLGNLYWPRGVIKIPGGGGKTYTISSLVQITNLLTLFIVDKNELKDQAIGALEKAGLEVSEDFCSPKKVTVVTIQSLMGFARKTNEVTAKIGKRTKDQIKKIEAKKDKKREAVIEYLNSVEQVVVDEAHGVASSLDKGNLMYQALELMPNAFMRWGLTATPFEREEYSNLLLEGSTGDVVVEIPVKELIEKGWLASPKITICRSYSKKAIPKEWPKCYMQGIVLNEERNNKIIEKAMELPKPCMILLTSIQHGEILQEKFKKRGKKVLFAHGGEEKEFRNDVLKYLRNNEVDIVIASKIWDQGVDIQGLRTVILAGGGKSSSKTKQRLYRGMRIFEGKNSFELVDFFDERPYILKNHSIQRKKIWIQEGYEIHEERY